ncbi:NADH-quinone oxidoreductase subunit M [Pleionea sp. CnH1-48]|uniref:NADH-quinone oxidoreductase subunit M n=1 Tax=Pleionea sp. CnH1-48 TaxID=2954494 RepID=UPI0020985E83|nr:NADH-quinone oxidoreductase subunit M [Pleionea sp. CnH1-48]MCO7225046.1 NADH-quinone oxidoreductase subunit M [Pleionea sp. CnH1-48]
MAYQVPWLSLIIWVPILGGLSLLFGVDETRVRLHRWLALALAIVTFALTIPVFLNFDSQSAALQFVEKDVWFESLNIYYYVGVDGFTLPLIMLTSFMTIVVILAAWRSVKERVSLYLSLFLMMCGLMNGVFAAADAILFYVFWEAMLVPMFMAIGIWGGPNRVYATIKFFLYTFIGSVLMLIALIYLGIETKSFEIAAFHQHPMTLEVQSYLFWAFFIAFAVKVPMWPVHTWLPDAHVEAPTGGSVILAAIMLKMGAYGFIRFSLPITPDAAAHWADIVILLSLIAVVYIGLVALAQEDMKKLIAYSSIAHMGFVTLGFFITFALLSGEHKDIAIMGIQGGLIQMISHGFISGAMFLCIGVLYDRLHSRMIADYGGVANAMPKYAALFMVFAMANAGLPGTSGFVGEFMVILAAFHASPWYAFFAATTLVLGAAYTLWMYRRVMFGETANNKIAALKDLDMREMLILSSLAILVFVFGLWPAPLLDLMSASVEHLVECGTRSKISLEGMCKP